MPTEDLTTEDLSRLSDDEIATRVREVFTRAQDRLGWAGMIETRADRALVVEGMDAGERADLEALKAADERRRQRGDDARVMGEVSERSRQIGEAIGQAVEMRDQRELGAHFRTAEERALRGEGYRFRFSIAAAALLEERSTTTANAGARHEAVVGTGPASGIWLPRESGANVMDLPPGTRLENAVYGANSAVSATAEAATKPVLDPTSLGTATVSPYAVSSNISIQSQSAGRGVEQFTWAGTRKVRRSINDAFTAAMVTAGGTARAFATSAVVSLDGGIAFAMAEAAAVPSLIVCSSELFTSLANAGGGNLSGDAFPAYRGIRLVSSTAASLAGNALVIDGGGLNVSLSGVEVRTQPQVLSNSVDVVVEVWFAVTSAGANAVVLQDCTTP